MRVIRWKRHSLRLQQNLTRALVGIGANARGSYCELDVATEIARWLSPVFASVMAGGNPRLDLAALCGHDGRVVGDERLSRVRRRRGGHEYAKPSDVALAPPHGKWHFGVVPPFRRGFRAWCSRWS